MASCAKHHRLGHRTFRCGPASANIVEIITTTSACGFDKLSDQLKILKTQDFLSQSLMIKQKRRLKCLLVMRRRSCCWQDVIRSKSPRHRTHKMPVFSTGSKTSRGMSRTKYCILDHNFDCITLSSPHAGSDHQPVLLNNSVRPPELPISKHYRLKHDRLLDC